MSAEREPAEGQPYPYGCDESWASVIEDGDLIFDCPESPFYYEASVEIGKLGCCGGGFWWVQAILLSEEPPQFSDDCRANFPNWFAWAVDWCAPDLDDVFGPRPSMPDSGAGSLEVGGVVWEVQDQATPWGVLVEFISPPAKLDAQPTPYGVMSCHPDFEHGLGRKGRGYVRGAIEGWENWMTEAVSGNA